MIKLLQSKWICALMGAFIYLGSTVALWKNPKITPRVMVAAAEKSADAPKPSWEFHSTEADELITDLLTQKQAQTERARKLDELEARLKAERQEIATVVESVKQQQNEFDRSVVRVHEEEIANLKRLAKIYSAMSPEGAVSILRELKDDDVVKIFAFMKDGETAPILETLARQGQAEAKRAAQISDPAKSLYVTQHHGEEIVMSSTSVFLGPNPAIAAPPVPATDDPPLASPDTQADGQASFARIMSDATADGPTDASPSSSTRVTSDKSEKDGKRKDDKTPAQQVTSQIVATLVPPQTPPPALIVPTGTPAVGDATSGALAGGVETAQVSPLATGKALETVMCLADTALESGPRNRTNTKQPTAQLSAEDLKASSMPNQGSARETGSSVINVQLPTTEPLSAPNMSPVPVEDVVQPAPATAAGTAIAKQVGRVKTQEKTENNSEAVEKNLPPTSLAASAGATNDAAKPRTTFANLPQREGRTSIITDTSTPILAGLGQGKTQPLSNNTNADAARSPQIDKVFTEISERVMSFKRMGTDSAEVNLRPDNNTEITLSLNLRNGQVEMTARLERGNLSALNPHWTGLQQSLSQQGVRVGQLTSSQSAMNDQLSSGTSQQGFGENTSRSFERLPEGPDELSVAGSISEPLKGRPQKAIATWGHGWEMWA